MKFIFVCIAMGFCSIAFCQTAPIKSGQKNKWITDVAFDVNARPASGDEAGIYYLLIDEQTNLATQEAYSHYAYRVLSADGIQENSDLTFEYDPSYSILTVHHIRIHRDGKMINQLTPSIKTMQREESMERYMYDGSITGVVNLLGVRLGDVIEYDYTVRGFNPIYKGHFATRLKFDYYDAFERMFRKLIVPSNKTINLKYVNTSLKPDIDIEKVGTVYSWSVGKTKGTTNDDHAPTWYTTRKLVLVSDFSSWGDVSDWGLDMYNVKGQDYKFLQNFSPTTENANNSEAMILKAVRFVQDEVRYLSMSSGMNSHLPHAPEQVFAQRFGDCKDKSLLLCTILKSQGVEAYPVFIATDFREKTEDELPSITAFDHCVVQIKLKDKLFYVDPTVSNQGGSLGTLYFPSYGKGLVIGDGSTHLTTLPEPTVSSVVEKQEIDVPSIGGGATLEIVTTARGDEADNRRATFSNSSKRNIQKGYLEFYANLYPSIEVADTLTIADDRANNEVTITEHYKIPKIWTLQESSDSIVAFTVKAQSLETYFNISKLDKRDAPYSLTYPLDYEHRIRVKLPISWGIASTRDDINSEYYTYKYRIIPEDDHTYILSAAYHTLKSDVPKKDFAKFVSDHGRMINHLAYSFSYNHSIATPKNTGTVGSIVNWLSVLIGILGVYLIYSRYDPAPKTADPVDREIGGWLILIALGLILSPCTIIYQLFKENSPGASSWMPYIKSGQLAIGLGLLLDQIYNLVLVCYSVLLLVLFFQRRSSVPRLIVIFYATSVAVQFFNLGLTYEINNDTFAGVDYGGIFKSVLSAAIWIPYFIHSDRVKETFVKQLHPQVPR